MFSVGAFEGSQGLGTHSAALTGGGVETSWWEWEGAGGKLCNGLVSHHCNGKGCPSSEHSHCLVQAGLRDGDKHSSQQTCPGLLLPVRTAGRQQPGKSGKQVCTGKSRWFCTDMSCSGSRCVKATAGQELMKAAPNRSIFTLCCKCGRK